MNKKYAIISSIIFCIILSSCIRKVYSGDEGMVKINGTLKLIDYYGPPGYGENPKEDQIEKYFTLFINPKNIGKYRDVTKIQLLWHSESVHEYLKANTNKIVSITGSYFYAETGHHHTDILINIIKIK